MEGSLNELPRILSPLGDWEEVKPNYSDIIKMAEAAGYSYDKLILKILDDALNHER